MTDKTEVALEEEINQTEEPKIHSLNDLMDIEEVILRIHKFEKEVKHFKEYKKLKNAQIAASIAKKEDNIQYMKFVIKNTLEEHGEKDIDFPGVGKVANRKLPMSFEFTEEDIPSLMKWLEGQEEKEIAKNCITKIPASKKLVLKEVKKVLKVLKV